MPRQRLHLTSSKSHTQAFSKYEFTDYSNTNTKQIQFKVQYIHKYQILFNVFVLNRPEIAAGEKLVMSQYLIIPKYISYFMHGLFI